MQAPIPRTAEPTEHDTLPPAEDGEIAIHMGPLWETWSPHDIEHRSLGGTETAVIRVAQGLVRFGYRVTVYGEVEDCEFDGVTFTHYSRMDPAKRRLAVIAGRFPEFFDSPFNARKTMLWMQDPHYYDRLTPRRSENIDYFLALNDWHFEHFSEIYPFTREKLRLISNGIELDYFTHPRGDGAKGAQAERRKRVVSTSSPTRGIDILLELWPRIRARVPDAELAYCYAETYDNLADIRPRLAEHRNHIRELTDATEGTTALGSLSQPEVAKLLLTSLVWAHPSWDTPAGQPFLETSPVASLEAQAAGCVVVASNWGGLQGTVKVGCLIDAEPPGERWRSAFVDKIVDGLINPETQAWAQMRGPKAVAGLNWHNVAERMACLIADDTSIGRHRAESTR